MQITEYLVTPAGLPLVIDYIPDAETVFVGIIFRGGSAYQGTVPGAAHFLEHCLFNGSRNYPNEYEVRVLIDETGGLHNGETGRETVKYFFHCLPDHLERAGNWLSEVVCRPRFDEEESIRERDIIASELRIAKNNPQDSHNQLVQSAYWGNHPIAEHVLGTAESIVTMSPQYLRELYWRLYCRENAQVVFVGSVDVAQAREMTDNMFGELSLGKEQPAISDERLWQPMSLIKGRPGLSQSYYTLGFPCCFGFEDPRRHAAQLIGQWLSSPCMPLYRELRDDKAWVYGYSARANLSLGFGNIEVSGQVAHELVEPTLKIIRVHIDNLCDKLISDRDLDILRNRQVMSKTVQSQNLERRFNTAGYQVLFSRTAFDQAVELKELLSVDAEQIRSVAEEIFSGPEVTARTVRG